MHQHINSHNIDLVCPESSKSYMIRIKEKCAYLHFKSGGNYPKTPLVNTYARKTTSKLTQSNTYCTTVFDQVSTLEIISTPYALKFVQW